MRSSAMRQFRLLSALLCMTGGFLVAYIWLPHYANTEIRKQIRDFTVLRPGVALDSYERFVNSSDPNESVYYTRFYFFNISNLQEVREQGAKPVLRELGPYTYRTVEEKYDLRFYWNGSLSYKERTLYFREADLTVGDFDDVIFTLNLPLVGVLDRAFAQVNSWILERLLSRVASMISQIGNHTSAGLFTGRTVEELLWGYDDPVLKAVARFSPVGPKFRFMQNGTTEDESCDSSHESMINTGLKDLTQMGQFEKWNGRREIENWNNHSEPIRGTSGSFFQPFLTGEEELSIWVDEMYRTLSLYKASEAELHGIRMFRYRISSKFWDADPQFFGRYNGLINITSNSAEGTAGPPVFFSPPHFCGADPVLKDMVIGMNCSSEERDFYIDVEPYTGISLRAAVRFMISSEYSSKFKVIDPNLSHTVLPVFWLEMSRQGTEKETDPIRNDLYWALDLRDNLSLTSLILTVVLGLITVCYLLRMLGNYLRQHRRAELLDFDRSDYRFLEIAV